MPALPKWPFVVGDLLLLGLAYWILRHHSGPLGLWPLLALVVCVAAGAWLGIKPFLIEYETALRFAETASLTTAVAQIKNLQSLSERIGLATTQWHSLQEQTAKSLAATQEMGERMATEAKSFGEFMQKATDAEKSHLRLEVEKLRRGEGDWLQTIVRLLDHVYALYKAGVRSGQPNILEQLNAFQNACRDVTRRLGLTPFEPRTGEPFDKQNHQVMEGDAKPGRGACVGETLATGYTYQGRLLRCALVTVQAAELEEENAEPELSFEESNPTDVIRET